MKELDEKELMEYIRSKLFEVESVYLEPELIYKVLEFEIDYMYENGFVIEEED